MDKCLASKEIVQKIVGCFDVPRDFSKERDPIDSALSWLTKTSSGTLTALACTSKRFTEPCLDVLWRDLESMHPIFVVLGVPVVMETAEKSQFDLPDADPCEIPRLDDHNLTALLGTVDLAKASHYLRRVKQLYVNKWDLTNNLLSFLSDVTKQQDTALFPNLRSIVWDIREGQFNHDIKIFASSHIKRISVHPTYMDASLYDSFPNLTEIECLRFFRHTDQHVTRITRAIEHYPHLTVIDCFTYEISAPAFDRLASMPDLRELAFERLPEGAVFPRRVSEGKTIFFPSLRKLRIGIIPVDACRTFIRSLREPRKLQQLQLSYPVSKCADASPQKLLSDIGTLFRDGSLTDLAVTAAWDKKFVNYEEEMGLKTPRTTTAILEPLLQLKGLQVCKISFAQLDLDDDFIERLSSACPHLVNLSLQSLDWYKKFPNMTLRSLYSLAKNCPHLERVQLPWLSWSEGDANVLQLKRTWDHEKRWGTVVAVDITLSGVDDSPAWQERAREVAGFLEEIFPKISWFPVDRIFHYVRNGLDAKRYNS